jgi:hypothetical protein
MVFFIFMFRSILQIKFLSSFLFILITSYLIFHTIFGNHNLQNYFIYKFEVKLFEDNQKKLLQKIENVDKDLWALYSEKEDMSDELRNRNNPYPNDGEILIKID